MIDPFDRPEPGEIESVRGGRYVLCEGQDEAALVRAIALLDELSLTAGVRVRGGRMDEELAVFRTIAPLRRPRALGVVVDKEKDAARAGADVQAWLAFAGFQTPASAGVIVDPALDDANLMVGYFLNPDHASAGAIEQLFVGQVDPVLAPCIEDFIACVEGAKLWEGKRSPDVLKDKVTLRVYLAAKKAGGNTGLSVALQDRNLKVDTPAFDSLREFLRRLCA